MLARRHYSGLLLPMASSSVCSPYPCRKAVVPSICSATPVIRQYLQGCIHNIVAYTRCLVSRPEATWPAPFSSHGLGSNRNITMHWLFLIVISAAHTLAEVDFALPFLARPQIKIDPAHFRQVKAFTLAIKSLHQHSGSMRCGGKQVLKHSHSHDGLDMLVSTKGPLSVFDLSSMV